MRVKHDLNFIGKRIGRLVVMEEAPAYQYVYEGYVKYQRKYKCRCDCGNEVIVFRSSLTSSKTVSSCGCYAREQTRKRFCKHTSAPAGSIKTRLYRIWRAMLNRTSNTACAATRKNYFDRGIRVCGEWAENFVAFRDWALANGYRDDLTIDRINNDEGYCATNCRWASHSIQAYNKRTTVKIAVNGDLLTLKEVAESVGLPVSLVRGRYDSGYTSYVDLTRSREYYSKIPKYVKYQVQHKGTHISLAQIARETGLDYSMLFYRYNDCGIIDYDALVKPSGFYKH